MGTWRTPRGRASASMTAMSWHEYVPSSPALSPFSVVARSPSRGCGATGPRPRRPLAPEITKGEPAATILKDRPSTTPTRKVPTARPGRPHRPRHRPSCLRHHAAAGDRGAGRRRGHPGDREAGADRRPAGPAADPAVAVAERVRQGPARAALPRPPRRRGVGGAGRHPDQRGRRRRRDPRDRRAAAGAHPRARHQVRHRPACPARRGTRRGARPGHGPVAHRPRRTATTRRSCWSSASTAPARRRPAERSPGC